METIVKEMKIDTEGRKETAVQRKKEKKKRNGNEEKEMEVTGEESEWEQDQDIRSKERRPERGEQKRK